MLLESEKLQRFVQGKSVVIEMWASFPWSVYWILGTPNEFEGQEIKQGIIH